MSEIDQYDYDLPPHLIAQQPLHHRADARLMVIHRQDSTIQHRHVRDLPEILRANDCLVLNNTKVIPARLVGYRTRTHGRWSGLFLEEDRHGVWRVLGKTRGKMEVGELITLVDRPLRDVVQLRVLAKLDGGQWAVRPESQVPTMELLGQVGRVPLPHYIRGGEMVDADGENYQTVFAKEPGAVAAPTAGLHFTDKLLEQLEQRGIQRQYVTLHVGIGTFRPVKAERLEDHVMHQEWGVISADTVDALEETRAAGGRVVAVGTTSVRILETAGGSGSLSAWQGETDLFIRPPYEFKAVDALLTNFHLPKSTLLVLVRTFGGDALMKRAYAVAVDEEYRFFSYGDAMLIL